MNPRSIGRLTKKKVVSKQRKGKFTYSASQPRNSKRSKRAARLKQKYDLRVLKKEFDNLIELKKNDIHPAEAEYMNQFLVLILLRMIVNNTADSLETAQDLAIKHNLIGQKHLPSSFFIKTKEQLPKVKDTIRKVRSRIHNPKEGDYFSYAHYYTGMINL